MTESASKLPLAGLKAIELHAIGPVPFAGQLLRSLGARVVRVSPPAEIDRHCALDTAAASLLRQVARRQHWSSRTLHRVQKLARTIADLADAERIDARHVAEAVGYRRALDVDAAHGATLGAP